MLKDIIATAEAAKSFFPTPEALADKLLEGLDWDYIHNVLEPSAGKGNLVKAVAAKNQAGSNYAHKVSVDCIECDPYLRQVLQYEFGGQRLEEIQQRLARLNERKVWNPETRAVAELGQAEAAEEKALKLEQSQKEKLNCHIVHDDFLTYASRKPY